jgi:hypothetical protein
MKRHVLKLVAGCLLLPCTITAGPTKELQSDESFSPIIEEGTQVATPFLSAEAEALAKQLGIMPMIIKLGSLQNNFRTQPSRDTREEIIFLRQQLTDILQYSAFQVQDVLAAIDSDLAYTDQIFDYLAAKKNRRELATTVATFMTTGALSTLNSAVAFGSTGQSGNILGTISGAASMSMPTLNFYHRQFKSPYLQPRRSNMLAQIFDRPTISKTEYNSTVWSYLTSVPPSSQNHLTRRQLLLRKWRVVRQVNADTSQASKRSIDLLTENVIEPRKVSLSLLVLRGNLLSDVRAEVGALYRDLAELKAGIMAL